ncbi:hypothetical protein FLAV_00966 [Flavobacteriales bacterium]|nr:hypothetical protein FLAV_00966 [Flavobacteriales bacterium]
MSFSFFLVLLINTLSLSSQVVYDTIIKGDSLLVKMISEEGILLDLDEERWESDTFLFSLDNFQRYKFFNNEFPFISLGNIGSPAYNFNFFTGNLIQSSFLSAFDVYTFKRCDFYSVNRPFTSIQYTNGYKAEQTLNIFHSQNFLPLFNIAFGFNKINSTGFYAGQKTDVTGFFISTHYTTKNKRYASGLIIGEDNLKSSENGGIRYLDDFYGDVFENRELLETRLDVDLNKAKTTGIRRNLKVIQQLGVFRIRSDSASASLYRLKFAHEFTYNKSIRRYEDLYPNSGYYDAVFIDSIKTNDIISVNPLNNNLKTNIYLGGGNNIVFMGGYEFWRHNQNWITDTNFNNIYTGVTWSTHRDYFVFDANAKTVIDGYNKGDFEVKSNMEIRNKMGKGYFNVEIRNEEAPFFLKRYYSNHFDWEYNDFSKRNFYSGCLGYLLNRFSLNTYVQGISMRNIFYIDAYGYPKQYLYDLYSFKVGISGKLKWWRLNLFPHIYYQSISEKNIVPIPNVVSVTSLFYSSKLFKSALLLQVGADVFYYSKYYGYGYMPATGMFYLQNEMEVGNYPYIDLFMNVKIKRVKCFIKYEHANAGMNGYNFMSVPYYPNSGRALRVGLWWGFLN